ncbi:MAG: hypothetical protein WCH52_08960 [Bacteroidota bacterium]
MKSAKYTTLFLSLFIFSCSPHVSNKMVGNDRDVHGCIGSAGYQWSEIKKECIRPFELQNKWLQKDSSIYCYTIISKTKDSLEIYSSKGHFLFKKKKEENGKSTYQFKKMKIIINKMGDCDFF